MRGNKCWREEWKLRNNAEEKTDLIDTGNPLQGKIR